MEKEQHPWLGKHIYMDFGDGVNGGETSGTVLSADDTYVTVGLETGSVKERIADAIYVEVEDFGVIDV